METEIYLMEGNVEISEGFSCIEEILDTIGTGYNFIDVKISGYLKRLFKGIDY